MVESGKKKEERVKVAAVPDPDGQGAATALPTETNSHRASGCPVALCPICMAVSLIEPYSREVVEHLLNAGRELLLAAQAALDAVATDSEEGDEGSLEKIDIG